MMLSYFKALENNQLEICLQNNLPLRTYRQQARITTNI